MRRLENFWFYELVILSLKTEIALTNAIEKLSKKKKLILGKKISKNDSSNRKK